MSYVEVNDYNGIKKIPKDTVEISYSSGKDSDVILRLAQMADIRHTVIRKDTTIDPPHSNQHARDNGAIIIKPKETFFSLCDKQGMPNRWSRFCCSYLKEYKVLDVAVHGIRKNESVKRAKRYKEPTYCRNYNKKDHVEVFMPILEWSQDDVKEFILSEKIKLHPLYYRQDGTIDVSQRLGCIGCPLASKKKKLEQFKQYPLFVKRLLVSLTRYRQIKEQKIINSGREIDLKTDFGGTADAYEHLALNLFCDSVYEFELKFDGMFGRTNCKNFLENYFKIKF